jgi:hypothetical protein
LRIAGPVMAAYDVASKGAQFYKWMANPETSEDVWHLGGGAFVGTCYSMSVLNGGIKGIGNALSNSGIGSLNVIWRTGDFVSRN